MLAVSVYCNPRSGSYNVWDNVKLGELLTKLFHQTVFGRETSMD